ncbi:hypothetical protein GIB67_016168, partial [Kingdonia uniflora]
EKPDFLDSTQNLLFLDQTFLVQEIISSKISASSNKSYRYYTLNSRSWYFTYSKYFHAKSLVSFLVLHQFLLHIHLM